MVFVTEVIFAHVDDDSDFDDCVSVVAGVATDYDSVLDDDWNDDSDDSVNDDNYEEEITDDGFNASLKLYLTFDFLW